MTKNKLVGRGATGFLMVILVFSANLAQAAMSARMHAGDTVAICGDSITEQRQYSVFIEDYLLMCQPMPDLKAHQFGWSGEKADGFLNRMRAEVLPFGPTVATTCYTFANAPLRPRLFFKADIASGDQNPNNPNLNTFNALFPKGAYLGETGLIGPANIIDVHPGIELQLTRSLSLVGDWDFIWRESTSDGIYNNALKLVRTGGRSSARYIGSQAQAMLQWSISRHFAISAVYAHFFAGEFLEQSPPGKDVNYFSAWLTFRF